MYSSGSYIATSCFFSPMDFNQPFKSFIAAGIGTLGYNAVTSKDTSSSSSFKVMSFTLSMHCNVIFYLFARWIWKMCEFIVEPFCDAFCRSIVVRADRAHLVSRSVNFE
jgi:hypothetical protein